MDELPDLKRIGADAADTAVDKAQHYRLLGDPGQAVSICHDVLAVAPEHQRARSVLVLALTDRFADGGARPSDASTHVAELESAYERAYFSGLVAEREGRALLGRRGALRSDAWVCFRDAMAHYEEAESLRPPGVDDAILRWNSCVRTLRDERLTPPEPPHETGLE